MQKFLPNIMPLKIFTLTCPDQFCDWPVDRSPDLSYISQVIKGTHPMQRTEEFVQGIVIDICTRSFMLLSDQGDEKFVECDTVEQFMNVLEVVTATLEDDQIQYADLAIYENV